MNESLGFDGTNQMIGYHGPNTCAGEFCCFHHPSNHHMTSWPLHLRADLPVPLMERICQHGVGHPDPDSLTYLESKGAEGWGIHGCDGCCSP